MNAENKVIKQANKWVGYLEKKSNDNLDDFTVNAGSNNYTCFASDYKRDTGLNLQAQPWCAMFVSEVFVQAYGLEKAKELLCGALYHNCQVGADRFKQAGRWHTSPQKGDVIFFTNGTRAYHTGLVIEVTSSRVKTIEGNTSGASSVVENGGGVHWKSYSLVESRIMGYGRPDYSIVDTIEPGWVKDQYGWWYRRADGSYPANKWCIINHHWYLFNKDGYACTGWHRWDGQNVDSGIGDWYFFHDTMGAEFEGAMYVTKSCPLGVQEIAYIDAKDDI